MRPRAARSGTDRACHPRRPAGARADERARGPCCRRRGAGAAPRRRARRAARPPRRTSDRSVVPPPTSTTRTSASSLRSGDEPRDARRPRARHPVVERGLRLLEQLRREPGAMRRLDRELARDLVERGGHRQDDAPARRGERPGAARPTRGARGRASAAPPRRATPSGTSLGAPHGRMAAVRSTPA